MNICMHVSVYLCVVWVGELARCSEWINDNNDNVNVVAHSNDVHVSAHT